MTRLSRLAPACLLLLLAACDVAPAAAPARPLPAPGTFEATAGPVTFVGVARVAEVFYQEGPHLAVLLEPDPTDDPRARGLASMSLLAPGQRLPAPGTYRIDASDDAAFGFLFQLFEPQTSGTLVARTGTLDIEISTDSTLAGRFSAEVPAPLEATVQGRFHARGR